MYTCMWSRTRVVKMSKCPAVGLSFHTPDYSTSEIIGLSNYSATAVYTVHVMDHVLSELAQRKQHTAQHMYSHTK